MEKEPRKRIKAVNALKHEWITSNAEAEPLDEDVLKRLESFNGGSLFRKALVRMLDPAQLGHLRD